MPPSFSHFLHFEMPVSVDKQVKLASMQEFSGQSSRHAVFAAVKYFPGLHFKQELPPS